MLRTVLWKRDWSFNNPREWLLLRWWLLRCRQDARPRLYRHCLHVTPQVPASGLAVDDWMRSPSMLWSIALHNWHTIFFLSMISLWASAGKPKCFHTLLVLLTSSLNSPPLTDLLHRESNFVVAARAAGTPPIIILLCISIYEIHLLYCVAKMLCRDISIHRGSTRTRLVPLHHRLKILLQDTHILT